MNNPSFLTLAKSFTPNHDMEVDVGLSSDPEAGVCVCELLGR